jgi:phosphoglycolate phosphatase-like HAD superfamily hydrolase
MYIGDEFRDMAAARKAGVQAVAVTWGYHAESLLRQTEPNVVVNQPSELLEWILREAA